ncbi:MAG TPA: hypothetical protein VJ782_03835, partial [Aeromicrobium sp.]|nr:hypothetical protein [Aeromicrobium sp.]
MYDRYKSDPGSVDPTWRAFFDKPQAGDAKPNGAGVQPQAERAGGEAAEASEAPAARPASAAP